MFVQAKVDFKRPKHAEMANQGYTSVDMHFHTKYSDGTRKVPAAVKKARKLGIGLAITDHNEIRGAIEISKYKDLLTIPGIETTTKEGIHLLHYFYNTEELAEFYNHNILPNKNKNSMFLELPFLELFDISKDYNSLIVAPHPYGVSWTGVCCDMHKNIVTPNIIKQFDGIEVINGSTLKNLNKNALYLAESLNMPITGGSDGHRLFELGKVLTYTKETADREAFLDSVRKGNVMVVGKESNMVQKLATHSSKIAVPVKNPIAYIKRSYNYLKQQM